jgi:hypothetical protein
MEKFFVGLSLYYHQYWILLRKLGRNSTGAVPYSVCTVPVLIIILCIIFFIYSLNYFALIPDPD